MAVSGSVTARKPNERIRGQHGRLFGTVLFALALAASAALLPFLHVAANRLVVGTAQYAPEVTGGYGWIIVACGALGTMLLGLDRGPASALAAAVLLAATFLFLGIALGHAAAEWSPGQPAATRVRLASGAWTAMLLLGAGIGAACRRTDRAWSGRLATACLALALVALAKAGWFDHLSLAIEYHGRREAIQAAIFEHLALCGGAVVLAVVAASLLYGWARARSAIDLAINGVQVVPAVALFGGLVAATSALLTALPSLRDYGLSALGPGPAILGIAAYLLLPFWRGIAAGLRVPDPATMDAAAGLGLTPRETLTRVQLPLGAPVLVGALRVAVVQSIGLATLGALIGAGGLGRVVFDGMAQFAPDLILLGAIPVVAMSLAADACLGFVERHARERWQA